MLKFLRYEKFLKNNIFFFNVTNIFLLIFTLNFSRIKWYIKGLINILLFIIINKYNAIYLLYM